MGYGISPSNHAHFLFVVFLCAVVTETNSRYVWKTGLWQEPCQHYSCGRGGSQFRSVFCGQEGKHNYMSFNEKNCQHLPKPKKVRECFKVCKEHENLLRWAPTVWSECMLDRKYIQCARRHGVQYRNITCVWRNSGFVEDDSVCSEFEAKNATVQQCNLKCAQDCVVSPFSKWRNCDTCLIVNKTRTRQLLIPPANGGKSCPTFSDMVECSNCSNVYTFKVGPWSECSRYDEYSSSNSDLHPLIGFQTRNILCLNSHGASVRLRSCIEPKSLTNDELTDKQTCIIPQDCRVTEEWSRMTPLNSSCINVNGGKRPGYMVRTRSILQIPLGTGKPCPPLVQTIEVQDTVDKPCPSYTWVMSSWSECQAPAGSYHCTTGLQSRTAICVQGDEGGKMKPVSPGHCTQQSPVTNRVCEPECNLDCTVSQWSEWSECKVTDCELYARRRRTNEGTGQRFRTRRVLTAPNGHGDRCTHLSETQMCDPQPCYTWNISAGPCQLLNSHISPPCGLGVAYRTLSCMNKYGLRASDSLCEELAERPESREDCNIPCPTDCILSLWSPWSPCPNLCQEGRSRSAMQTRERTVLAQQGLGGAPCPPNRQLEEAQPCPTTIECAIYVWQTEAWGVCRVVDRSQTCGSGKQAREVNCYSLQGQLVSDQRCTLKVKPTLEQECTVPCPLDCRLTDFSDWSECSKTCWEATQMVPVQTRKRYALQSPLYGGAACPEKMTEHRVCTNLPLCHGFHWDTDDWSQCYLPPQKIPQCGQGLQARNVSCKSENNTDQDVNVCFRHSGPIPPVSRVCYKTCDEECVFEEWLTWSHCINGCNGNRFRTRKLADTEQANPKCEDRLVYPIDMFEKCLCGSQEAVTIGNWSECILEPAIRYKTPRSFQAAADFPRPATASGGVNGVCGPGKRYKAMACLNDRGEMDKANRCSHKSYEEEVCMIACPVDCVMSDWSPWSDCSTSCGTGSQIRYRYIKQLPSDGGRSCPALDNSSKETLSRVCTINCLRYEWHAYSWSVCIPTWLERQCGEGSQSRNVGCMKVTNTGVVDVVVDDSRCSIPPRPPDRQTCYLPCVGEYVVSNWKPWSKCSQPCNQNQVETRTRVVLRQPVTLSYNRPNLLEERFCVRGDNCVEYRWHMSAWTSCIVNHGLDDCGVGLKERYPVCKNHVNQIVDGHLCLEAIGEATDMRIMSCETACDVDCLFTEWAAWSECSTRCGMGERVRTRSIVQEPHGNGRLCPTTFQQKKPCFDKGCYTWLVSPWSACSIQAGVCGHGTQTRNVSCVGSEGLAVDLSKCPPNLDISVIETSRVCRVSCPGECVLTDWSEWNDCFIDCKDFQGPTGYSRGVQSRSRAVLAHAQLSNEPCPEQHWESRPCKASDCYSFYWKHSAWSDVKDRHMWCERSDGLLVTGGCPASSQPATHLSCHPKCSVSYSFCNDSDVCSCDGDYEPVYNQLNLLVNCKMAYNNSITEASSKTVTVPGDALTNAWMYALIAVGTLFVVFLAVACFTMSEFFRKGPRPRQKDEEKSLQGADLIDGMQSETAFVSCNHVPRVAAEPDCDSVSLVSADRTPPPPVGALCEHVASTPATHMLHAASASTLSLHAAKTPSLNSVSNHSLSYVVNGATNASVNNHGNGGISHTKHVTKPRKDRSNRGIFAKVAHSVSRIAGTLKFPDTNSKLRFSMHDIDVDISDVSTETVAVDTSDACQPRNVNDMYTSIPVVENYRDTDGIPSGFSYSSGSNFKPFYAVVDKQEQVSAAVTNTPTNTKKTVKPAQMAKTKKQTPCNDGDFDRFKKMLMKDGMDSRICQTLDVDSEENSDDDDFCFNETKVVSDNDENLSLANLLENYFSRRDCGSVDRKPDRGMHEDTEDMHIFAEDDPLLHESVPFTPQLTDDQCGSSISSRMSESQSCPECQTKRPDLLVKTDSLDNSLTSTGSHGRQRQLAVCKGPMIQIEPEIIDVFDYNQDAQHHSSPYRQSHTLPTDLSYPSSPSQLEHAPVLNKQVGYSAFSSFDTETSTIPSTSVSCDSVHSGVCDFTSDQSFAELSLKGQGDRSGDRSPRNIAMTSLQDKRNRKKSLKNVPMYMKDSGLGMKLMDSPRSTRSMGYTRPNNTGLPSIITQEPTAQGDLDQVPHLTTDGEFECKQGDKSEKAALLSPFSSLDVDSKRMKLRASRSCGHLDQSDNETIHRALDKLRLYVRYGSKFSKPQRH